MGSIISKDLLKRGSNGLLGTLFWQCALTAALIELCEVSASLINGIICARFLGANEVAAIGLANPYFATMGLIGGLFYTGTKIIYTSEIGRGNIPRANGAYTLALLLIVVIGGLCSVLLFLFPEQVAVLFGAGNADSRLIELTTLYLQGLSVGTIPFMLKSLLAPLIQVDGHQRLANAGSAFYMVFVVALDIAALRLGLGIFGIGIATSIPYWIDVLVLCTHFLRKNRILRLSFKTMEPRFLVDFLSFGSTVVFRKIYRIATPLVLNRLILAVGGAAAMSAFTIQSSLLYVLMVYSVGINEAVGILAGIYHGERNKETLQRVAVIAQRYCLISSAIICVFVCALSGPIAAFYVGTQGEIHHLTQIAVFFAALIVPIQGLVYSKSIYLQATKNVVKAQMLSVATGFVFALFPSFALGTLFGGAGILASGFTGMALCALCMHLYEMSKSRSLKPSLDVLLALPADFEVWPGDVIDLEIRDHGALALTLEQFDLFCKGHKLDARKALRARGCIEELCSLILDYGESQKANCIINLRVIFEEGDVKTCIRYTCKDLNLGKMAELIAADGEGAGGAEAAERAGAAGAGAAGGAGSSETAAGVGAAANAGTAGGAGAAGGAGSSGTAGRAGAAAGDPEENLGLRMALGLAEDIEFFDMLNIHTAQITV